MPDEIARIGLAPSYKAIAMAILLNRYSLLGIVPQSTIWFDKPEVRPEGQISLFDAAEADRKKGEQIGAFD